jgi:hypothetical protein
MSLSGLCQVCESREATHVCDSCGNAVCDVHFDEDHGVCTVCAAAAGRGGGQDDVSPGSGGGSGRDDVSPGGDDSYR